MLDAVSGQVRTASKWFGSPVEYYFEIALIRHDLRRGIGWCQRRLKSISYGQKKKKKFGSKNDG